MSEQLKACPFCGTKKIETYHYPGGLVIITCSKCTLAVQTHLALPDDAIKQWNARPIEDALRAELAAEKEKHRWIPVSEGDPTEDDIYDVFYTKGKYIDREWYSCNNGWATDKEISCYRRIPPLPEVI